MDSESSKICRLCLVEAEVMCPIFNSYSKNNPQSVALPQRIMSFAQIKVVENDGLPSSICYQCLAQVDKSYQFKLQCEQSDATLRQSFQEQLDCESESGDWEMMKFTPEVIINEGDENSEEMNESQEDSQLCESDSDSSMNQSKNSSYPLSEVQALLRHHGTEIRLQAVNGKKPPESSGEQNGSYEQHSMPNGSTHQLPPPPMDYFPLYGVEAVLNNQSDAGPSYRPINRTGRSSLPPLLPRLTMNNATLSSLLQRKGEFPPELSILSPNGMQRTRRSRDGQKLFQCRLCPKSYSFSSALSRHKAVHNTELRPHICNICKKGFADPEKLERHMRTHVSDQVFPCDICGRVFKALATFERHKLMTQGKCRVFSCMMCGLGFPNKSSRKLHACRAVASDGLYPCPQCSQVFNTRESFESHVASHSGISDKSMNTQALTTAGLDRRSI